MSPRLVASLAALALAGCAMVGPDYQRPEGTLPGAYGEVSSPGALAVPERWWTLFRDPTLDELVASGLERNADVRAAAARVEEAEAALREAHAIAFFPLVQGSAGANRGRTLQNGTDNAFTLGLSTSFEVDLWGRLRRGERSVRDQLLATQYGRDTVSLTLAASIARAYFAARSLESQVKASEEALRAAEESQSLARRRAEGGVASNLDVYQAGAARAAAAAQTRELQRQRSVVVHQLGQLAGRPDLQLPVAGIGDLPVPPTPPAGLPSDLLERRPDVRQSEAQLAAATERIGVARGSQFPALTLTGSFGGASPELSDVLTPGAKVWSIGAGLLGPIFDAGRYAARTEQAEAQARQAAAGYQRSVETAFREVSDALVSVVRASETERDLAVRLDEARNALKLADERYRAGYSAYLEVLDAQRVLNDAQLTFIRNRQAYLSYSVDLMNALGGGWKPGEEATVAGR